MPGFGKYEAISEIHRGPLGSVWTAKCEGRGDSLFAVKTYEPGRLGLGKADATRKIEAVLDAAREHHRFTSTVAPENWAPVHEVATFPDGAEHPEGVYVVTDYYATSLAKLIATRVKLSGAALVHVMDAVLGAFKDFADDRGRTPGSVRPDDVFLAEYERVETARVMLKDPGPAAGSQDLLAVADLVFQLIFFRRGVDLSATVFGNVEQVSEELRPCFRFARYILEAHSAEALTLDETLREWEKTRRKWDEYRQRVEKQAKTRRLSLIAGVVLLLIAVPVAVYFLLPNGTDPGGGGEDLAGWELYRDLHFNLLGDLFRDAKLAELNAKCREHPILKGWANEYAEFVRGGGTADPDDKPSRADQTQLIEISRKFETSMRTFARGIGERASKYRDRGWEAPAGYLESLATGLTIDREADIWPSTGAIDSILAQEVVAAGVEENWQTIAADLEAIEVDSANEFLRRFRICVGEELTTTEGAEPGPTILTNLAETLSEIRLLSGKLAEFMKTDWEAICRDELPPKWKSSEQCNLELYREFHRQAGDYRCIENPVSIEGDEFTKRIREIDTEIARLEELEKKEPSEFRGKLGDLKTRIEQDSRAHPAIKKHEGELTSLATARMTDLAKLLGDIRLKISYANKDLLKMWTGLEKSDVGSSEAIRSTYRKFLAKSRPAEDITQVDVNLFNELTKRLERDLLGGLRKLDGRFPEQLPGKLAGHSFFEALNSVYRQRREKRLAEHLSALPVGDAIPDFLAGAQKALPELDEFLDLADQLGNVEDGLEDLFLLGDIPPRAEVSVTEILEAWRENATFKDQGVQAALAPLLGRVQALERIAGETDIARLQLTAQAEESPSELILAAWRRLGELPWPDGVTQLVEEGRLRTRLRARITDKRPELSAELAGEGRRRWERCFGGLSSHKDVARALEPARIKNFAVDMKTLGPASTFKAAVSALREDLRDAKYEDDEAAVKERVGRFLGTLPEELADLGKEIDGLMGSGTGTGADVSEVGPTSDSVPSALRWQEEKSPDSDLKFTWKRGDREDVLYFVQLEDTGDKPSFISTTEVTVGLFLDVVTAADSLDETYLRPPGMMPGSDCISVWESDGDRIKIAATDWWRNWDPAEKPRPPSIFPQGLRDRIGANPNHPMQFVSLGAALRFSGLLGCRLPTVQEWKKARDLELSTEGSGRVGPNLRDESWNLLREHFKSHWDSVGDTLRIGANRVYPDVEIFRPDGEKLPRGRDAQYRQGITDGYALFREQKLDGRLHDLVGNVAEFVTEGVLDLESTDPQIVTSVIQKNADKFKVVGASALSPPRGKPEEEELSVFGGLRRIRTDKIEKAHSDVGFRLAFTAPRPSLHRRLTDRLDEEDVDGGNAIYGFAKRLK